MYALGWAVFRDRLGQTVPPERRRRLVLVGVIVAVAAAVVLVIIGLLVRWPDLGDPAAWAGVVLIALAAGLVGAALVPLRPRAADGTRLYWSGSTMQAPERTERYFRGGPAPTIDQRDRDEVLRDADAVQSGLLPDLFRGFVLAAVGLFVIVAGFLLGATSFVFGWILVFSAVRTVVGLVRLGRVERARALAESLPSSAGSAGPDASKPARRGPNGSKIRLPVD